MLTMFTTGRDYRPGAFWAGRIPPNAVYARVLVAAADGDAAVTALRQAGLGKYIESLRPTGDDDGPAAAVAAHLLRSDDRTGPAVFVIYREEQDALGTPLPAPLILTAQLLGGELRVVGKVAVVGMGRPDAPYPVMQVVPDDGGSDPVPVPPDLEGPAAWVPLVEGVLPFPQGEAGDRARGIDDDLLASLAALADELAYGIEQIGSAQRSGDPRVAWMRQAGRLDGLARQLAELAQDAQLVEKALRPK